MTTFSISKGPVFFPMEFVTSTETWVPPATVKTTFPSTPGVAVSPSTFHEGVAHCVPVGAPGNVSQTVTSEPAGAGMETPVTSGVRSTVWGTWDPIW